MAGSHCTSSVFLVPPGITRSAFHKNRLKPLLASSISTASPSRRMKRKNHLRPKILKTLTKPFPTAPLPEIVPVEITNPIDPPPPQESIFEAVSDEISGEIFSAGETNIVEEVGVNPAVEYRGRLGKGKIFVGSVLKCGGYLVGLFLFYAVCAVFIRGRDDFDVKEDGLNDQGNVLLNGNAKLGSYSSGWVYYNDAELKEKINEIRAMAREVREKEKKEVKVGNQGNEIEKEIGARLLNLESRWSSRKSKLPETLLHHMGLFEDVEDELGKGGWDSTENRKSLMLKKNQTFKSRSINLGNPKGFTGWKDHSGSSSVGGNDPNRDLRGSDFGTVKVYDEENDKNTQVEFLQTDGNNSQKERRIGETKSDLEGGKISSTKVTNSWKLRDWEAQSSQSLTAEIHKLTVEFNGSVSLSIDGIRDSMKKPEANKVLDKQSNAQKDLCWQNLSYVLIVHMHRGLEGEGPSGFYAFKMTSQEGGRMESSYTLAFEDHGDAKNFCFLLKSFYEDLGDFSADIVPLSMKELREAVESHSMKVIVVRKGQLKLYAGQPLPEVEMALQSLFEQNQST